MKSSKYTLLLLFIGWWKPVYSWKVIVERYEIQPVDQNIVVYNISLTRFNRTTQIINGRAELFVDVPDNAYVVIKLYGQYSNKYNELPLNYKRKICDIYNFEYNWIKSDLKGVWPKSCPIKKGIFYIENYTPNVDKFPPIPWDTNKYMAEGNIIANKKIVCSGKVWVRVTREDEIKIAE